MTRIIRFFSLISTNCARMNWIRGAVQLETSTTINAQECFLYVATFCRVGKFKFGFCASMLWYLFVSTTFTKHVIAFFSLSVFFFRSTVSTWWRFVPHYRVYAFNYGLLSIQPTTALNKLCGWKHTHTMTTMFVMTDCVNCQTQTIGMIRYWNETALSTGLIWSSVMRLMKNCMGKITFFEFQLIKAGQFVPRLW